MIPQEPPAHVTAAESLSIPIKSLAPEEAARSDQGEPESAATEPLVINIHLPSPKAVSLHAQHDTHENSYKERVTLRLVSWFGFTLALGLLPLIGHGIMEAFSPAGFSLVDLLSGGDLFVVSSIIAGSTLDGLFDVKALGRAFLYRKLAMLGCFLLCATDTICFIASSHAAHSITTFHFSLWLFGATLLASGTGAWLAVER